MIQKYWRWIISLLVGLADFAIALNAIYHDAMNWDDEYGYHERTVEAINRVSSCVEEYRAANGTLPSSLLRLANGEESAVKDLDSDNCIC